MTNVLGERERAILSHIEQGLSYDEILRRMPGLLVDDVYRAAGAALKALDARARPESREARIARMRQKHPRAFEAWSREEDARVREAMAQKAKVADVARELGRQPGAIRRRMEKLLAEEGAERRGD